MADKRKTKEPTASVPTEKQEPELEKDLCSTCLHKACCTSSRQLSHPVRACDEFEVEAKTDPKVMKPAHQAPATNDAKGLCRTCERIASCDFPKSEGGVWHCKDYK